MTILEQALNYLDHKMSVIPVNKNKKPLIVWKEFQTRLATVEEVTEWFTIMPDAQIGIACGKISNLTVVDIEKGGTWDWLPQNTTISRTGGGGRHYFYKYCEGIKNSARIKELVDIRSEGGFCIVPPSSTEKGPYDWIQEKPMLEFPKHLFEKKPVIKKQTIYKNNNYQGYGEGERNEQMAKYIGHLLAKVHPTEWNTLAWNTVLSANSKNNPPLDDNELMNIFKSIANTENSSGTKRWYEDEIKENIEYVKKEDYKLRYTWGTKTLDDNFAIIKRTNFIVIGAKRSSGKTTVAFDIACKNAKLGHKILYISLEMEEKEIVEDFARKYSGITIPEERDYKIPEKKKIAFEKKVKEIKEIKNLNFEGVRRGGNITWGSITNLIGKYPDADLIFIDNLDLIEAGEVENDLSKQKRIVKSIMSFTSENKIPIILIHHYRKQGSNKSYGMDELSGSGKISDGADIIVKITRNQEPDAGYPDRYESKIFLQKARGYREAFGTIFFIQGTFVDVPPLSDPKDIYYDEELDINQIKFN